MTRRSVGGRAVADRVVADDPGLARLLLLTDRRACAARGRELVETVELAVSGGVQAVVMREKDLPRPQRHMLARRLRGIVPQLIVASDVELALAVGADGVHLAANDGWPGDEPEDRDLPFRSLMVGRSCHDAPDVERAVTAGASYATLSPVFPSTSKPGYGPALGPDQLGGHSLNVYALGGVGPGRVAPCIAAGARGVAVMGAVMGAPDPAAVVGALLAEIDATIGAGVGSGAGAPGLWSR